MDRRRVVVLDAEQAVADAFSGALSAALSDMEVDAAPSGIADAGAVVVATWPCESVGERSVVLLRAAAPASEAHAARAAKPAGLVSRAEPVAIVADAVRLVLAGATFVSPVVAALLAAPVPDAIRFTGAELRLLRELAERPDTRSRLAQRLGITASTLDNHVAAVKRKVLADVLRSQNAPVDGYLSMEALIGWATRQRFTQES